MIDPDMRNATYQLHLAGAPQAHISRQLRVSPHTVRTIIGFVVSCRLAWSVRPLIRFLYVKSRSCSALPSDDASRRRPCDSLPFTSIRLGEDLHLQTVKHARQTRKKGHPPRMAL
jgi:hypothetical protein